MSKEISEGSKRSDYLNELLRPKIKLPDISEPGNIKSEKPYISSLAQKGSSGEWIIEIIDQSINSGNFAELEEIFSKNVKFRVISKDAEVKTIDPLTFAILPQNIKMQFDKQTDKSPKNYELFREEYINAIEKFATNIHKTYPESYKAFQSQKNIGDKATYYQLVETFTKPLKDGNHLNPKPGFKEVNHGVNSENSMKSNAPMKKLRVTLEQLPESWKKEILSFLDKKNEPTLDKKNQQDEIRGFYKELGGYLKKRGFDIGKVNEFAEQNTNITEEFANRHPKKTTTECFLECLQKVLKTFGIDSKFIENKLKGISPIPRYNKEFLEKILRPKDKVNIVDSNGQYQR